MNDKDKRNVGIDCIELIVKYALKGATPEEIFQFIDECKVILEGGGNFTVGSVNLELENRNITKLRVTEDTLCLMINILKKKFHHTVKVHSIN